MTEQTTTAETAARSAERIGHLLRPRTAADQLRAIFAGGEHADDGRIAALARELLAESDAATATLTGGGERLLRARSASPARFPAPERAHR